MNLFWLTRKFYNCYHAKVGTKCYASGWGGTLPVPLDEDTSTFPDKLNAVKLKTISDAQCRNMCENSNINWPRAFLKDFEVCVGGGGKGACHGDSGGPFICEGKSSIFKYHRVPPRNWYRN